MSNQSITDVSIIIVNYNTASMTLDCINSVFNLTEGITFEVILVDNASTDNSKELFSNDNRITYIYNEENLGFGRANNIAIEMAKGRNILFLNSDTLLMNNAIKMMSNYLDSHLKTGACGGNLYNANGEPEHSFERIRPSLWYELDTLFLGNLFKFLFGKNSCHNYSGKPMAVAYLDGADLMVKSDVLKKTGMFNPSFFLYYEETELCYRIHKKGYSIESIPGPRIIHLVQGSSKNKKINLIIEQSRTIYYTLTHSKLHLFIANSIRLFTYSLKQHSSKEVRERWVAKKSIWDEAKQTFQW